MDGKGWQILLFMAEPYHKALQLCITVLTFGQFAGTSSWYVCSWVPVSTAFRATWIHCKPSTRDGCSSLSWENTFCICVIGKVKSHKISCEIPLLMTNLPAMGQSWCFPRENWGSNDCSALRKVSSHVRSLSCPTNRWHLFALSIGHRNESLKQWRINPILVCRDIPSFCQ